MTVAPDLLRDVEAFLFHEAALLDAGDLETWLALFTESGRYWLPLTREDFEPPTKLSIVYDDRAHLAERVQRIVSGDSFTQTPPSRLCHLVSNIVVAEDDGRVVDVASMQLVVELRGGQQALRAAHCRHHLVRGDDGFMIDLKKVVLLDLDEPMGTLTCII